MAKTKKPTDFMLKNVPGSFLNVLEPKSINGSEAKYSASLVFKKTDKANVAAVKRAVEAAKEDGKVKKWGGKIPPNLKLPLRDGDIDRPDDETYEGCYFINATSKDKPQIVDRKKNPITDPMDIYSGCILNVTCTAFPFNSNGNRGIGIALGNIQKVADGTRLSGRSSADDDFDELEDEDEELLGDDMPDYLN